MRLMLLLMFIIWTFGCSGGANNAPRSNGSTSPANNTRSGSMPVSGYEVVKAYPHDPDAFTQGLIFHEGYLYEGTGEQGESTLRKVELETGKVVQKFDL